MSVKVDTPRAIWVHLLIPLVALTFYLLFSSLFLSWLLPEYSTYVNPVFVSQAWKYSLLATAGVYLVFFVLFRRVEGNRLAFESSPEKLHIGDFVLVLAPLTPVVQYILSNQDILSPLGSVYIGVVFVAFSVLFIIAIPVLLRIVSSTRTLMIMGVAFTFTITNMASLSATLSWYGEGSLWVQLTVLSALFLVGAILYNKPPGKKFVQLFIALVFIVNSVVHSAPASLGTSPASSDTGNKLVELVGSRKPLSTPSIYLLVYDSYVNNETMQRYGLDNGAQEKYLETLGFTLYPHTYSIGSNSLLSMSRMLNASTEFYGDMRKAVSGQGIVHSLLEGFGYRTCGIFWSDYFFQGIGSSYALSFPETSSSTELILDAILLGEFRYDLAPRRPLLEQYTKYKMDVLRTAPSEPRFVYTHEDRPSHSGFTGDCDPNGIESFKHRVDVANSHMRREVETILESDRDAVVIVAGDHGPYLTKNCYYTESSYDASAISRLDVQDRYGAFLAIKWPTDDFAAYDDIVVLQDVFPAVFAYLFQDDTLLQARVEPTTLESGHTSGVCVKDGTICGGINDGEPLFVDRQ